MTSCILFDTHAWIWLIAGEQKFSEKTLAVIEELKEKNLLFLSAISLWEISMLSKKGRINIMQPLLPWLKQGLKETNIHIVPITPEIAVESVDLPGEFHGDPADRLIVASARIFNYSVLTRDEKILKYSEKKWVHCLSL